VQLYFSNGGHGTVKVESRDDTGALLACEASTFKRSSDYKKVALAFGADPKALLRAVDAFRTGGTAQADVPPEGQEARPAFAVVLRGRHQPAEGAPTFPDLRTALEAPCAAAEPLLHWNDADRLCCVDADTHGVEWDRRLTDADAARLAGQVTPRPQAFWRTHGRGLRLVYEAQAGLTASELAGVAALSLRVLEPLASLELKTVTRHPGHPLPDGRACGPVTWQTQTADASALKAWLGTLEADDDAVATYLAERGLEAGARYPHDKCPVAGGDAAGRDPVCVRDGGIYCHACAGRGVCRGSRRPGWFPFAALCGALLPGPLRAAIKNRVHWEHARFLVEHFVGLAGDVARACYSAALACAGHDRRLVDLAFRSGHNFVRYDGWWGTCDGGTYTKDFRPILARLPACCYADAEGVHADPELIARFEQPVGLAAFGYVPLRPVWGVRITERSVACRDTTHVPIVLQTPGLTHPGAEPLRPRYVPAGRRVAEGDAWAVLERAFPGLNREAVKLLVAARGCQEAGDGMPPFVFISGPSGGSKSSLVHIAAAICGDRMTEVPWTGSSEKLRQGVMGAKRHGSYAVFNEYLKDSGKGGKSPVAAMDFLLTLTPESTSHVLYVGPVPLGTPPVCVWTDTYLPAEVKQDVQIARRLVHVPLLTKHPEWKATMPAAGVPHPSKVRVASQEFADACNAVLSAVVDEFFEEPLTFHEIALRLGFRTLEDSAEAEEGTESLKALFAAACAAPPIGGADAKRWKGRGWRVITREQQTDLAEAWRLVCDEGFTSSRRCTEVDWARLLGVPEPVAFEIRAHGTKVAVRWVRRRSHTDYDANDEIFHSDKDTPLNPSCDIVIPQVLEDI
jgi:hypothetical protein